MLDTGLAVLSLAAGPVLGAFLVGVLTTRVGSRAMIAGMVAGIVVLDGRVVDGGDGMDVVRALIGSSVTFVGALAAVLAATTRP